MQGFEEKSIKLSNKKIAELDEVLSLSNPVIQNTIQESNAIPIGCIEVGYSSNYKLGLAVALCNDIQSNRAEIAMQHIRLLHNLYQIKPSEEILEDLIDTYDLDIDAIQSIFLSTPHPMKNTAIVETTHLVIPPFKSSRKTCFEKSRQRLR